MSRLKALLAKMDAVDAVDAMDATPHLISNAGENVRHTQGGEYGIRCNLASIASITSFPPLASPDDYAMAERLAIQDEDDLPPDRGFDDILGFDDVEPVTLAQRRAILYRLYGWANSQEINQ